jgi:hypothetical protein
MKKKTIAFWKSVCVADPDEDRYGSEHFAGSGWHPRITVQDPAFQIRKQ